MDRFQWQRISRLQWPVVSTRLQLGVSLAAVALAVGCGVPVADPLASASSPATTASPSATTVPTPTAEPSTPTPTPSPTPTATTEPEGPTLPRGGRKVFPTYRLVGYAGLTGASTLGRLGTGPLDQRVRELECRATAYEAGRRILPVLEVI